MDPSFRRDDGIITLILVPFGPYAYSQLIRLHKLRDRLLAASPSETSIISLASDLGFNQAGRLSVTYRKHFG